MNKKKAKEWKKTSIRHTLSRAKQRSINIGKEELNEITHNIIYEDIKPIREQSAHRKIYKSQDKNGIIYFLVFDDLLDCIVTVFRETQYNFSKKADETRTQFEERKYKQSGSYIEDWLNG